MKELLLDLFSNKFTKPLDVDEIFELLNLSDPQEFTQLAKALNELEDEFIITHNSAFKFAPLSFFNLSVGVLDVKDGGYGFSVKYGVDRFTSLGLDKSKLTERSFLIPKLAPTSTASPSASSSACWLPVIPAAIPATSGPLCWATSWLLW